MKPLDCIACGIELESSVFVEPEDDSYQMPSGATIFSSGGNYGSGLWDPPGLYNNKFLEFNICDDCLTIGAKAGRVFIGERPYPPPLVTIKRVPWEPEGVADVD